jgi:aubergine-like protein
MVCGMDVFHQTGKPSAVGFVATYDKNYSQYTSEMRINKEKEELTNSLEVCLASVLETFKKQRGDYPENIILYRDGVGDSQSDAVIGVEAETFGQAFKKLGISPKIVIIMVNKRVNTKLFLETGKGYQNP